MPEPTIPLIFPVFRTEDGYHLYRVVGEHNLPVWVDNLDPKRVDMTHDDDDGLPAAARQGLISGKLETVRIPARPVDTISMFVPGKTRVRELKGTVDGTVFSTTGSGRWPAGSNPRPVGVKFDDGYQDWFKTDELVIVGNVEAANG